MTISLTQTDATPARVPVSRNASSSSDDPKGRVPLTMPSDQTYYWTAQWQRAEAESLADYDAGEYVESDSPDEIIRWLNESDDESAAS